MKIWFELKDKKKPTTIRIVVAVGGLTIKRSTGEKINPANRFWNNGYPTDIIENKGIRLKLNKFQRDLESFETKLTLRDETITPYKVNEALDEIFKKKTSKLNSFDAALAKFVESKELELAQGTIKAYRSMVNHLNNFQKEKNLKLTIEDINEKVGAQFRRYLIQQKLQNPTINKVIRHLRGFAKWAYDEKLTTNQDFYQIKRLKLKEQTIVVLTPEELKLLEKYEPKTESLKNLKAVFLMTCYSGLRYSDLFQINKKTVIKKGNEWRLRITQSNKNKKEIKLPLVPKAVAILEKYDFKLPIISNQKSNLFLKTLIKEAGIESEVPIVEQRGVESKTVFRKKYDVISIHDGRKTFISTCLISGMHIEVAMQLSTHSQYASFKRYVQISEDYKSDALYKAFEN